MLIVFGSGHTTFRIQALSLFQHIFFLALRFLLQISFRRIGMIIKQLFV